MYSDSDASDSEDDGVSSSSYLRSSSVTSASAFSVRNTSRTLATMREESE